MTSPRLVQCTKVNLGFLSLCWRGQLSLASGNCHRHEPLILRNPGDRELGTENWRKGLDRELGQGTGDRDRELHYG